VSADASARCSSVCFEHGRCRSPRNGAAWVACASRIFPLQWTRDYRRSLIEPSFALEQSFIAFAWIPNVKRVTFVHRCHPSTDSLQCCTCRTTQNRLRGTAPFSIFPARAELFAVRSLLTQPDLLLVHRPSCSLEAASSLGARLLTTLDQAGVQQEHISS
jgi:hypothetical protein